MSGPSPWVPQQQLQKRGRSLPQPHRFLLGDSFRVSHFFSWWYILAALSYSRLRFPQAPSKDTSDWMLKETEAGC